MNNLNKIPTNLDLDALRAFVKGIELGSFQLAAQQLCRSPAAISAQLKKLEQQTQCQLLRKSGRGLVLTAYGEVLLSTVKQMLKLNDQILVTLNQNQQYGKIRFGLQEDFGESILQALIARFIQLHPNIQFQIEVDRNQRLIEKIQRHELDLALIWSQSQQQEYFTPLTTMQTQWLYCEASHIEMLLEKRQSIPLVTLQHPCLLREMAIKKLDQQGLQWHIAYECNSVHALWAALRAGIGISLRALLSVPEDIQVLKLDSLPLLDDMTFGMYKTNSEPNTLLNQFEQYVIKNIERKSSFNSSFILH
ncbi:LysR family transcriptional regulator [Acinetobacter qingfengensis]|uniref:Transcriptional regulator n=1 Tax=Acinetobacter qingfengensis TaxID=1262585 RepID=A0A1E7QXK8_9GAMM|nr:LysR substrate-binding domain-containing protein [Acinetobacter qingfengensis]KAA8731680.1 LysR family transcriptional regulator [Acinetobacter qingfengensis]OEY91783.1 transcriptional regulator [Acinetobacter qingfengensis]